IQNRLNTSYFAKGNVKTSELLETQSPVRLILLEPSHPRLDSIKYSLTIRRDHGAYIIEDEREGSREYSLGQKIASPIGPIMIIPQKNKILESDLIISFVPV